MPCYKDLALTGLPNGVIRGSHLARTRGSQSTPDFRTWDPAHTVDTAKQTELRNVEVLRRSAQQHILRSGAQQPRLRADPSMEESCWFRTLDSNRLPPSQMSLGRRGYAEALGVTLKLPGDW
mmetsp:Transcript_92696/g.198714  ORF Transcript_92696/g.198714 Transcript_92696/m.198714 type:complete len:122 (+) Transcript_92696:108-473(+)